MPQLQKIGAEALGIYRNGADLDAALSAVQGIYNNPEMSLDSFAKQSAEAVLLILNAALLRKESRGTHNRLDYPEKNTSYEKSFTL